MEMLFYALRFIGVIFLVLMIFNVMIIVHEWGHFLAGRWRGLAIDRFQIWFGKPIWKKTYNGVQYGLGTIPFGGFVSLPQMVTMESIEGEVEEERKEELPAITPLDKIIVAFAGPFFSFLLAVFFALIVWAVKRPEVEASATTTIGYVGKDTAAEKAGIEVGDVIKSVDGVKIKRFMGMGDSITWAVVSSEKDQMEVVLERPGEGEKRLMANVPRSEAKELKGPWWRKTFSFLTARPPLRKLGVGPYFTSIVEDVLPNSPAEIGGMKGGDEIVSIDGKGAHFYNTAFNEWKEGKTYHLVVDRDGKKIDVDVQPRSPDRGKDPTGEKITDPMLGASWAGGGKRKLIRESPVSQVANGFMSIVKTLRAVFSSKSDITASHLSGPVGIMGMFFDMLFSHKDGWRLVLWFSVVLNVNLGILNLLPFPVLDGGHITMAVAEWIRKRPVPLKFLEIVQTGFVFLLLGYMAFITLKDVGDRVPDGGGKGEAVGYNPEK